MEKDGTNSPIAYVFEWRNVFAGLKPELVAFLPLSELGRVCAQAIFAALDKLKLVLEKLSNTFFAFLCSGASILTRRRVELNSRIMLCDTGRLVFVTLLGVTICRVLKGALVASETLTIDIGGSSKALAHALECRTTLGGETCRESKLG